MKTLCIDTAHKHLVIVLSEDDKLVTSSCEVCWKKQSETMFPTLIALMEEAKWSVEDLDQIVITDGPGSYTGVRIAMSMAKVLCTRKNIPLYVVSTLALYAGLQPNVFVMNDARSKRAYCAHYDKGSLVGEECILTLDEIKEYVSTHDVTVLGDGELINQEVSSVDFAQNFIDLIPTAKHVDNVHTLVPRYLKENDAYMVKS